MDLAIITTGILPVPPARGGAVESLIDNFLKKNDEYQKLSITVFSIYDIKADELSSAYQKTNIVFIKPIKIVKLLDILIFFIAKCILHVEKPMSFRYIVQRLYFLDKVSAYLSRNNYKKLLFENHPTLLLALKKRKNYQKYKGRYYYHAHNEILKAYGCDDLLKNCSNIICVSQYISRRIKTVFGQEVQTSVLKNCVDQMRFANLYTEESVRDIKLKYGIKETERVLLFTGRLSEEKGLKELLFAMQKIKNNNCKLIIAGSLFFGLKIKGQFEQEIVNIVETVKDKVIFTGFVPYNEMPELYTIADIAVLPSIWDDPAPLTIIESLSCGLPIITTDSGGIPEYVNEKCACILQRDDKLIINIAKNIDFLLSNQNLIDKMGKESLIAVKELTLDNYYLNLLSMIRE